MFGLLGATATALCCYVMPGLLYIKAANLRLLSKEAILPLLLVISGTYRSSLPPGSLAFDGQES